MIRVGSWADRALSGRVYDMIARLPLRAGSGGDGLQPLRDLDQLRTFLSGLGPTALFDLPWIPFYLALCYLFHPLIGFTALVGSIILVSLTVLTDILTRSPISRPPARAPAATPWQKRAGAMPKCCRPWA